MNKILLLFTLLYSCTAKEWEAAEDFLEGEADVLEKVEHDLFPKASPYTRIPLHRF